MVNFLLLFQMLIYFFSDRNYVRKGFTAQYRVTGCAHNCSGHGDCDPVSRQCVCEPGWRGMACDVEVCPHLCGPYGTCDRGTQTCACDRGYAGVECSLSLTSRTGQSQWHLVAPSDSGFTPRSGHSGAFISSTKRLYVFGGNAFRQYLNDMLYFDFTINQWVAVNMNIVWPSPRHGHAMTTFNDDIYMYGGQLETGVQSSQLWKFNPATEEWTVLAQLSAVQPPGVSYHTLTLVEDRWLYVFGGRTTHGDFSSAMYRYDLTEGDEWEEVQVRGGKTADRRLVGHSTVYHPESKSLLVFGGFLPDYARFPARTAFLHAFHVEENYWSQVFYEQVVMENPNWPKQRAYHSAVILGNYMVIYGGNYHEHHKAEICYDNRIYFYHLGCHRWVDIEVLADAFPGRWRYIVSS